MAEELQNRRLRAGIVGGGRGAFIGRVHRMAAELDGQALVIAGAMSSDPDIAAASARDWYLERSYDSFADMARAEAGRPDGIDFVINATPNHLHYPVAKAFLDNGISVVCDKPLTRSVEQAQALVELVSTTGLVFALTHNYTGYPMVREARARVRQGQLGDICKVLVEYHQDWLLSPLEQTGNKQALWRTNPTLAGEGGCVADIGSHAVNLLEYITGRHVASLCADLGVVGRGRKLDDDAQMLLRLDGGGKGVLSCSQIACGEENDLRIRIYGSKAGLEWRQQDANSLYFKPAGEPSQRLRSAGPSISTDASAASRLPPGHPEGYLEAFANIYRAAIDDIRRHARREPLVGGYPTAEDGLRGMRFIACAVASSRDGARWVNV